MEISRSEEVLVRSALRAWNELSLPEAELAVLPCNGSRGWASLLSAGRPYGTVAALLLRSSSVWGALSIADWKQAFDSHPRLGSSRAAAAGPASLRWSAGEQSTLGSDEETRLALAAANEAYEARFGRIFLACATGKSAPEILALLNQRMNNPPEAELKEAAEQQRRITLLRLRKWLGLPATSCDDV